MYETGATLTQSFSGHDSFYPHPVVQGHCPGHLHVASFRCLGPGLAQGLVLPSLSPLSWAALSLSSLAAIQTPAAWWFPNDIPSASAQGLWVFCLFSFFLSYLRSSRELKSRPLKAKHF